MRYAIQFVHESSARPSAAVRRGLFAAAYRLFLALVEDGAPCQLHTRPRPCVILLDAEPRLARLIARLAEAWNVQSDVRIRLVEIP